MKKILVIFFALILMSAVVVLYAYRDTWKNTELEFRIHINEQLVQESAFGESPTFAIWLENPETGAKQTVFVTKRAAAGDWEGKSRVPVALPRWFQVYQEENEINDLPTFDKPAAIAITGATPKPGYFTTRVRVEAESNWICWIEVNLSGDYNEHYQEYNHKENIEDEFGSGQPALLYKADIQAVLEHTVTPEITGISIIDNDAGSVIRSPIGITTASKIFDELSIVVVKPKPKILNN